MCIVTHVLAGMDSFITLVDLWNNQLEYKKKLQYFIVRTCAVLSVIAESKSITTLTYIGARKVDTYLLAGIGGIQSTLIVIY